MFSRALNNASLALVNSYRGGFCAFTQLYRSAQEDMGRFQQLAREKAELKAEQRQAWLQQSCEVIASGTDL
jgi:predicted aminopeptidase